MRRRSALWPVVAAVCSPGCSLVYDFGVFEGVEIDAMPAIDVNREALAITSVEPDTVFEGTGCLLDQDSACGPDSRGAVIVLHGSDIASDATVTATGFGFDETPLDVTVDTYHSMIGFALPIPVDTTCANGGAQPIVLTVRQGSVEQRGELEVACLNELVHTAGAALDVDGLLPRFSTISISGGTYDLVGEQPARLVATSAITIDAVLDGSGKTVGGQRAGGCLGGLGTQDGECSAGGGRKGTSFGGGGGGGNEDVGSGGSGAGAGGGGARSDARALSPLTDVVGNGGGGGGGAIAGQGAGGAGGGAIEITSGGTLTISAASQILATGQAGDGTAVACAVDGGAGGGGSGGAVLLRALAMTIEDGAQVDVGGGPGGTASGMCRGGAGSDGFRRLDGVAVVDDGSELSGAVRGAMWDPEAPIIVTASATASLRLAGAPGTRYFVSVNAQAASEERMMLTASDPVAVDLEPGLNLVCALVTENGALNQPESLNCIDVVYLP